MNPNAPIYGHSRGYRLLALLSIAAVVVSFLDFERPTGLSVVGIVGIVGFTGLFLYSWRRATKRLVVMQIEDTGFAVVDPTQHFGLIEFDEIDEIRIYAMLEQPMVAFHLADPDPVRRRGPVMVRFTAKALWPLRHYQIVVQLDEWNDQIAAIKSVAVKAGIPIRSELV